MPDTEVVPVPCRDADPLIRLDVEHWGWYPAAVLLEAVGGRPISHTEGAIYRFVSGVARDQALDLVRGRFGWTDASPFDGRP